jgi:hypothetical protein
VRAPVSAHLGARSLFNDSFVLVESGPDDAATVQFAEQARLDSPRARAVLRARAEGRES